MKHLKSINELLKSTLVSASAKASEYGQRVKSDKFLKHADEKGENVPVDRIFPHAFTFDYVTDSSFRYYVKPYTDGSNPPYFYITDWKMKSDSISNNRKNYNVHFDVIFKSNYGKTLILDCVLSDNNTFRSWLNNGSSNTYFKFSSNNRKDAVQFKKFLLEELTPEFLEDIEDYSCDKTADYILDHYDNDENWKFIWIDEYGNPSIYIGFFKDIPINGMIKDY